MPSESQHWRDLAKTTHARADQMKNGRSKRMLRAMGDFYERVAKRVERRLRKAKKSK
jgi:hypothetical protein